jgi:hypothetical protein
MRRIPAYSGVGLSVVPLSLHPRPYQKHLSRHEASHHLQAVVESAFGTGDATRHSNPLRRWALFALFWVRNRRFET